MTHMKMIKKITSVFMTFLVMAALVIGSTSVVFAADEINDTVKSTLITTAEGLTDTIVLFFVVVFVFFLCF